MGPVPRLSRKAAGSGLAVCLLPAPCFPSFHPISSPESPNQRQHPMSELASAKSDTASDAWSAVVSWLSLIMRTLLQVVSGTYCSWAPTHFLPTTSFFSVAFKPLPSGSDPEIPIITSTSPPLPASSPETLDRLTVSSRSHSHSHFTLNCTSTTRSLSYFTYPPVEIVKFLSIRSAQYFIQFKNMLNSPSSQI